MLFLYVFFISIAYNVCVKELRNMKRRHYKNKEDHDSDLLDVWIY